MARGRWAVATAGVLLQVVLGAVYAWSVFSQPLADRFGWSGPEITLTFTTAILTLGFVAFAGGIWMRRSGPRVVAVTGATLYGSGVALAGVIGGTLPGLYLSYGVLAGAGMGLAYIVPLATLVKWFPDRRGLMTGIAVGGFGAGALITAPVATRLIDSVGVMRTFTILGCAYLVLGVVAALFMVNPPRGVMLATGAVRAGERRVADDCSLREGLRTWQWYALWALLFLNVTAGIAVIGHAAPMAMELGGADALAAAGLVGLISVANGAGRVIWAWLSDYVGRKWVFLAMFGIQAGAFYALPYAASYLVVAALCATILLCYGGGFGTMPALVADYFGPTHVGAIYGLMLTAWGFASALGPLLFASLRETTGSYGPALTIMGTIMLASMALPFVVRPPEPGC